MHRLPEAISFPQDAASHPISNVEWWYGYALLSGSRGNRYAAMASFFRVGELAVPKGHYVIHSLRRLGDGRFECHSEIDRMLGFQMAGVYLPAYLVKNPRDTHTWSLYKRMLSGTDLPSPHRYLSSAEVRIRPTRLSYGSHRLTFRDDSRTDFRLSLSMPESDLSLDFTPAKPISLIDEKGDLNGLRYYSVTRNRVAGELRTPEGTERLWGEGWFDHQWGRNYGLLLGDGWDWFGFQLKDGNDLIVSRLRKAKPGLKPYTVAKLIRRDGSVAESERVGWLETKSWTSERSGATYPAEWRLSLPDFALKLAVFPLLADQEMPIIGPLRAIWEGVCSVVVEARTPDGRRHRVEGSGFVELVGYAQK
ncbi:lipocalin family protein [Cohnella suwonensis]|uniref:Lipocalin family protein n=1 Tax=Cohnella suwonensis TaxID=696072 RepID=A0ABW0M0M0_9BACL